MKGHVENMEALVVKNLTGQITKEELAIVMTWQAEHPEQYAEIEQAWNAIENIDIDVDTEKAWNAYQEKLSRSRNKGISRRLVLTSLSAACIVLLGIFFVQTQSSKNEWRSYLSQEQVEKITLDDGSIIWLNANSELKVAKGFNKKNRAIQLDGEAYFNVERNESLPFTVKTSQVNVEVLGTSFNVNTRDDTDHIVLLEEGSLSVKNIQQPKEVLLKPNESYSSHATSKMTISENANLLSWKTNKLVFDGASILEVKLALERHFNKEVDVAFLNKKCQFSSSFENDELEYILDILETICNE